jgi:hypothetical protein
MMGRDPNGGGSETTEDRRFRELFGCGAEVLMPRWTLLMEHGFTVGTEVKHLLWNFLFLKVYSKDATLCSIAGGGIEEKTFWKWV